MELEHVSRQAAKIVDFKKYNQSFYFILKDFCTDIIFELKDGTKISKTIYDINLPMYVGQPIELISVNDVLIAYEDKSSDEFYYLSNNPAQEFDRFKISWITIIIATILLYNLAKFLLPEYSLIPGFVFLLPLGYRIFRSIQDAQFEKKLSKLIVK